METYNGIEISSINKIDDEMVEIISVAWNKYIIYKEELPNHTYE